MARKHVAKVVLSKPQLAILRELARRLDTSESEILRTALMAYAKDLGVLQQVIVQNL